MSNEIEEQLAIFKKKYAASLPAKMKKIRFLWKTLCAKNDNSELEELHRMVHSLVGSSATFDLKRVSKSAKKIENYINEHAGANDMFAANCQTEIERLLVCLDDSINATS